MTVIDSHSERYQRQVILKEFGASAQEKLLHSKVFVAGAGGLGCPVLMYLAAAGTGILGIMDDDKVSLTNLHRQVLYTMADIGFPKSQRAAGNLKKLNPEIEYREFNSRLTSHNALDIIDGFDLVIDGTDNFATRYLINDACVLLRKPVIFGAVSKFEGQVAVFNHGPGKSPVNYRDLFPYPPSEDEVFNCADTGVLGVTTAWVGSMMANEAIKVITGIGKPLSGRMMVMNGLTDEVYTIQIDPRVEIKSLIPADRETFRNTDYEWLCSAYKDDTLEITPEEFTLMLNENGLTVIDVREKGELPKVNEFECRQIPLSHIMEERPGIRGERVVLFCQTGQRSLAAARELKEFFGSSKKIFSLKGGILQWKQNKNRDGKPET